MSWFFGVVGKYSAHDLHLFKKIHSSPIHLIQAEKIYVAAGGLKETCLCGSFPETSNSQESGWLVCGLGIDYRNGQFSLMSHSDWEKSLSIDTFSPRQLNGHFAGLKWRGDQVFCFTDQLGIRNLFLTQTDHFTAFSSRLDWIARLQKKCEIDWHQMGARWLLINQLSNDSILTHTLRLAQGGSAVCTPQSISAENTPWEPKNALDLPNENINSTLTGLVTLPFQKNKSASLALSGGLDSRLLLSVLLAGNYKNWSLHSFGDSHHPDVQVPIKIASDLGIEHTFLENPVLKPDTSADLLRDYIGQTMLAAPASGVLRLHFYSSLHQQNKIVIDGAKGEIARRRFLNRLLATNRKALLTGNPEDIYPNLRAHRASIFKKDIIEAMKNAAYEQIALLWSTMPSIREIGTGNWLDIMTIRTRYPNLSAEQSCADEVLVSYMPYAQPSFVKKALDLPLAERKNGRLFRRILHRNYPRLTRFPLVTEGTLYPYPFTTIPASLWTKMKQRLGYSFQDNTSQNFLDTLEDFIRDTVHSNATKQFEFYDYPAILKMVSEYFHGKKRYANELDWWLAFEIWRQKLYCD